MQLQPHIWHPYVAGTLWGGHIWLEKQEDPQGAGDPREGQQASETPCCMHPILSTRGCPDATALPEITTSSLWLT